MGAQLESAPDPRGGGVKELMGHPLALLSPVTLEEAEAQLGHVRGQHSSLVLLASRVACVGPDLRASRGSS